MGGKKEREEGKGKGERIVGIIRSGRRERKGRNRRKRRVKGEVSGDGRGRTVHQHCILQPVRYR